MILDSYTNDFSVTYVFFIMCKKFCFRCTKGNEIDTLHMSVLFHIISCSCLWWESDMSSGFKIKKTKCCFPPD